MAVELPDVPGIEVPCEMCGASIEAGQGILPLNCPKCGKRLRPRSSSTWNTFTFTLFHRLFTFRGRATRKEYWTFGIITSFLFAALGTGAALFYISSFVLYIDTFFQNFLIFAGSIFFLFILFIIPSTCIGVRRLHDIGISGKWAVLFAIIVTVEFFLYIAQVSNSVYELSSYIQDRIWFEENTILVSNEHYCFVESFGDQFSLCSELEFESQLHHFSDSLETNSSLMILLSAVSSSLAFFLLVTAFIDSTKGLNKYGISRKYLDFS